MQYRLAMKAGGKWNSTKYDWEPREKSRDEAIQDGVVRLYGPGTVLIEYDAKSRSGSLVQRDDGQPELFLAVVTNISFRKAN